MRHQRRLETVARRLGRLCPRHQIWLQCFACEPQAPMPEVLEGYLRTVIHSITVRVDRETLRAICARHLPPRYEACRRCGRPRECWRCQEAYFRAVLADVHLTADETRLVSDAMRLARTIDARGHDRLAPCP